MRGRCFPIEYYEKEVLTEVEARCRRRNLVHYSFLIVSIWASIFGNCSNANVVDDNQSQTEVEVHSNLNRYNSQKGTSEPLVVTNELRGGSLTEVIGIFAFIWIINMMKAPEVEGFQLIKPPHHQLPGVDSRPPRQGGYGYSSQSGSKVETNLKMTIGDSPKLTKAQRRNLPTPNDVFIKIETHDTLVIRDGQAKYKLRKHGEVFDLPFTLTKNGKLVTERTEENFALFKQRIEDLVTSDSALWFDEGRFQGYTERGYPSINVYDKKEKIIVVFKKLTKEFVTTCRLNFFEERKLLQTGNFCNGSGGSVLENKNIPESTNKDEL